MGMTLPSQGANSTCTGRSPKLEAHFLTKVVGPLGGDKGVLKELRVFGRVLRWDEAGISCEADPRRLEVIV